MTATTTGPFTEKKKAALARRLIRKPLTPKGDTMSTPTEVRKQPPFRRAQTRRAWLDAQLEVDTDDCILWPDDWATRRGYPIVSADGHTETAHRYVCRIAHGEPPPGRPCATHSCDVPRCCNRKHLRWASHAENMAEKQARGRARLGIPKYCIRGEAHPRARFTAEQVGLIRKSTLSHGALARLYDAPRSTISSIRLGYNWKV